MFADSPNRGEAVSYQWSASPAPVPEPGNDATVVIDATKPWGQNYEQELRLNGQLRVSDSSNTWTASTGAAELGAIKAALEALGWENVTFTTSQQITRTVTDDL
jgi:hypothetical protein